MKYYKHKGNITFIGVLMSTHPICVRAHILKLQNEKYLRVLDFSSGKKIIDPIKISNVKYTKINNDVFDIEIQTMTDTVRIFLQNVNGPQPTHNVNESFDRTYTITNTADFDKAITEMFNSDKETLVKSLVDDSNAL